MNTQLQSNPLVVQTEVSEFEALLNRDYKPIALPSAVEPGRRFVKVGEVSGEVEVERQIDFGYSVCALCGLKLCTCTPRIEIRCSQVIRYPVETVLFTQIVLG